MLMGMIHLCAQNVVQMVVTSLDRIKGQSEGI